MDGSEDGFTLIELVGVIVLVGILTVGIIAGIQTFHTIKLNQAVAKVVSDLRYAQQLAITMGTRSGLTIRSPGQYAIHIDNNGVDTVVSDPTNLGQDFVVDFDSYQNEELRGVRFGTVRPFCVMPRCTACGSVFEFNSLGVPTDTSGNLLCGGGILLTKSGTRDQRITFEANTGNIAS